MHIAGLENAMTNIPFQYFGSNSLRFDSNTESNNEEVGPGLYFKDDNKYSEDNKKVFLKR